MDNYENEFNERGRGNLLFQEAENARKQQQKPSNVMETIQRGDDAQARMINIIDEGINPTIEQGIMLADETNR